MSCRDGASGLVRVFHTAATQLVKILFSSCDAMARLVESLPQRAPPPLVLDLVRFTASLPVSTRKHGVDFGRNRRLERQKHADFTISRSRRRTG